MDLVYNLEFEILGAKAFIYCSDFLKINKSAENPKEGMWAAEICTVKVVTNKYLKMFSISLYSVLFTLLEFQEFFIFLFNNLAAFRYDYSK